MPDDAFETPFLFGLDDIPASHAGAARAECDDADMPSPDTFFYAPAPRRASFAPLPGYEFGPGSLPSFHAFPSYVAPTAAPAAGVALPSTAVPSSALAIPQPPQRTNRSPSTRLCTSLDVGAMSPPGTGSVASSVDSMLTLSTASLQGLSEAERRERMLAIKRERNRLAAERCRAKRVTLIQDLQGTCASLREERDRLAEENRGLMELLRRSGLSFDNPQ